MITEAKSYSFLPGKISLPLGAFLKIVILLEIRLSRISNVDRLYFNLQCLHECFFMLLICICQDLTFLHFVIFFIFI